MTVPLKDYVDAQDDALRRHLTDRQEMTARAVDKAEEQLRERLEGMNEFRDQLREQAGKFITRAELDLMIAARDEKIGKLEAFKSRLLGFGAIGALAVVLINFLIRLAFPHAA